MYTNITEMGKIKIIGLFSIYRGSQNNIDHCEAVLLSAEERRGASHRNLLAPWRRTYKVRSPVLGNPKMVWEARHGVFGSQPRWRTCCLAILIKIYTQHIIISFGML
jgi:hypothetical protein